MKNKPLELAIEIIEQKLGEYHTYYTGYEKTRVDIFLRGWERYQKIEETLNYLKGLRDNEI